ncbi:MAG: pilus assembly protein FilA, partial [Acinetobacter sp.]
TGYLQINTMKTASDAYIKGVHLGSATAGSIGDIEVQGLNVYNGATGTTPGALIKISGH